MTTIIAPGRFAVHISQAASHFSTWFAYQGAIDALEMANSFAVRFTGVRYNLTACPTTAKRVPDDEPLPMPPPSTLTR